jgi:hypothetical protein
MAAMRAFAAAALAFLALVVAGCGGSSSQVAQAGNVAGDAATLVPSDAKAFVAVNADLSSQQWQRVDALTKNFPARAKLIAKLLDGLDLQKDVAPALGPEVDFAVLGKQEVVAFTKPDDESKLSALAAKLSKGDERYTVQQIGGWSVVADSQDAFARVRAGQSGQSLGETSAFQGAWSAAAGDGIARAYAVVPRTDWVAARISADSDALRIDAVLQPSRALPALAPRSLLGDVPSGAALAVAFRGTGELLKQLPATKLPLKQLAPLLAGGGVLYARPAGLIPEIALELVPKDPQAAIASAHALLRSLAPKLGPLKLTAQLSGAKLVIADSPAAVTALRNGPKLVGDAAFKDAIKAAGVPAQTTFLAYADVPQLAPFVPVLVQGLTGKAPDPALGENLAHVGPVVAWGTREGAQVRVHAWIQPR